jgi:hypothetical protein
MTDRGVDRVDGSTRRGSGCGVQGCLYAAVGLFALLLIGVLVIAAIRFSRPPEPRLPPGAPPLGLSSELWRPGTLAAVLPHHA